jgi:hypothetical protein
MRCLHHFALHPCSRKLRLLLREKSLDFALETENYWERRPAFLKFNPSGEVPVLVDRAGFHPTHVGALPAECALLTQLSSGIEELAIEGSLTGDPVAIYRAIAHDPLTSAVLSLAEIRQMTNELFAQHKEYLPQFTHYTV